MRRSVGRVGAGRLATALLAALAAVVVLAVAFRLFPHHSANHDEGVYLQAAAMLLEGRLHLRPPVDPAAVRPWFFVHDGATLYPKYSPVVPAMFAAGGLLGEYRLALAAVAAGNVALVVALGTAAFDRRVGLVAGGFLLASPTFLYTSAVFLPYAPTTFLNLAFALAYLRADRTGSRRLAALAGVLIGLAFFARPYTALLFALPFVADALWSLGRGWRERDDPWTAPAWRDLATRRVLTAAGGLALVAVTLAYNAVVTGSPLVFPYEAFAPLDGLGFGRRRLLNHERVYTPALAVASNATALWDLLTRWIAGGPLGALLAAVGLGVAGRRYVRSRRARDSTTTSVPTPHRVRALLAGLLVSVTVGNLYFWGTLNALGDLDDPADGLAGLFGPFYHFDLLVPLSIFGAAGAVALVRGLHRRFADRYSRRTARVVVLVALLVAAGPVAAVEIDALSTPADRHRAYTDRYDRAYEPLADPPDDAAVFLPTPYGPWLNHPFQSLRNPPGFDGPRVYVLDRGPEGDFAAAEAFADRDLYRYRYRGDWTPTPSDGIDARLVPLAVHDGERIDATKTVGVPDAATDGFVRLSADGRSVRYPLAVSERDRLAVNWTLTAEGVRATGPALGEGRRVAGFENRSGPPVLPLAGTDELAVSVVLVDRGGGTLTYRQELDVRVRDGRVEAIWPPETSVCRLAVDCPEGSTYVPGETLPGTEGVTVETEARTGDGP